MNLRRERKKMEIKLMKEIPTSERKIDVLVYGRAGTGKTVLGSTFPSPIYIDADNGLLSVRNKDIAFISCYRQEEGEQWWQEVRKATDLALGSKDHKSIIIDSFPLVQEAMLAAIKSRRKGETNSYKIWEDLWEWTQNYVSKVRSCSKNSLFICGETVDKDEPTGKIGCFPALVGQAKTKVDHLFDEVYHAETKEDKKVIRYSLLLRPTHMHTAKSRALGKDAPTTHIDPHFSHIKSLLVK